MLATFNTIDALERELQEMGSHSAEYWAKQVHTVPKSQTVDRIAYLTKHAQEKTVLHIGCTGELDKALCKVAKRCYGIDQYERMDRPDYHACNLDGLAYEDLPSHPDVELVICGEVLEHLSNPGFFLISLREAYPTIPVIFTVPNAHCAAAAEWLVKRGRENVNIDHVAYYSYTTLHTLLARGGYGLVQHYWYGGKPYISEGLIAVAVTQKG